MIGLWGFENATLLLSKTSLKIQTERPNCFFMPTLPTLRFTNLRCSHTHTIDIHVCGVSTSHTAVLRKYKITRSLPFLSSLSSLIFLSLSLLPAMPIWEKSTGHKREGELQRIPSRNRPAFSSGLVLDRARRVWRQCRPSNPSTPSSSPLAEPSVVLSPFLFRSRFVRILSWFLRLSSIRAGPN